ncbi:uncharacterized [Tachysurus ichikawai]
MPSPKLFSVPTPCRLFMLCLSFFDAVSFSAPGRVIKNSFNSPRLRSRLTVSTCKPTRVSRLAKCTVTCTEISRSARAHCFSHPAC